MRLGVLLEPNQNITIPWSYRTFLTTEIYRLLNLADPEYSSHLHDIGFQLGKKVYRMFTFSDLILSNFKTLKDGIQTSDSINWQVSSPDNRFIEKLHQGLSQSGGLNLNSIKLECVDSMKQSSPKLCTPAAFRTISPIVVSVSERGFGHPPTYLGPTDPRFPTALERNLRSKWKAYYGEENNNNLFLRGWAQRSRIVPVFDIRVRAWNLSVQIIGSDEIATFAYDTGLGERNSQGFGMLRLGG